MITYNNIFLPVELLITVKKKNWLIITQYRASISEPASRGRYISFKRTEIKGDAKRKRLLYKHVFYRR